MKNEIELSPGARSCAPGGPGDDLLASPPSVEPLDILHVKNKMA